jgi:uncharacterized protein YpmB
MDQIPDICSSALKRRNTVSPVAGLNGSQEAHIIYLLKDKEEAKLKQLQEGKQKDLKEHKLKEQQEGNTKEMD